MQTAGDLVAVGIELTAGVQLGHDDLRRRDALFFVDADRDAAAIVDHGDRVIVVNGDGDFGGIPAEGFVDGVIDYFVDQVVQAHFARGADVHGGAQSHRLQAFEHFDASRIVNISPAGIHFCLP